MNNNNIKSIQAKCNDLMAQYPIDMPSIYAIEILKDTESLKSKIDTLTKQVEHWKWKYILAIDALASLTEEYDELIKNKEENSNEI